MKIVRDCCLRAGVVGARARLVWVVALHAPSRTGRKAAPVEDAVTDPISRPRPTTDPGRGVAPDAPSQIGRATPIPTPTPSPRRFAARLAMFGAALVLGAAMTAATGLPAAAQSA